MISLFEWILLGLIGYMSLRGTGVLLSLVSHARSTSHRTDILEDDDLPEALVILALRGADGYLKEVLDGLFNQDYPCYRVRIIVDHPQDPAWPIVRAAIAENEPARAFVEVMSLESPLDTCTLKCSALLRGTEDIASNCGVVAFLDSDCNPHRGWLRQLVFPLMDDSVGATTGNRWYAPPDATWGSWVRYNWNLSAVISMFWTKIPWGGSLAVKTSLLKESDLRQRWRRAGCDDVPLHHVLKKSRLKLRFVPSLMMVNRETCSYSACLQFVTRQLLWVRLYHPAAWWRTQAAAILAPFVLVAAAVSALTDFFALRGASAAIMCTAALGFVGLIIGSGLILELVVRRWLAKRGEIGTRLRWMVLPAFFLTMVMCVGATWKSLTCRQISWRGIDYAVGGPWNIRMKQYGPYVDKSTQGDVRTSL